MAMQRQRAFSRLALCMSLPKTGRRRFLCQRWESSLRRCAMRKVALVTGSAKGLGFAFAQMLAQQQYTVVLHYFHDARAARHSFTIIKGISPKSIMLSADLTKKSACKKIITTICQKYGRLDLLVNNNRNFFAKPFLAWSEYNFND